jgi:ABC-type lipoprotein release transport system permease subunit
MALGATPRQVQGLIFWQGMRLAALGLAIGLITAVALARLLRHNLAGLQADDPALIGMAAALVTATAAAACWVPAWRATRVDPVAAIRQE